MHRGISTAFTIKGARGMLNELNHSIRQSQAGRLEPAAQHSGMKISVRTPSGQRDWGPRGPDTRGKGAVLQRGNEGKGWKKPSTKAWWVLPLAGWPRVTRNPPTLGKGETDPSGDTGFISKGKMSCGGSVASNRFGSIETACRVLCVQGPVP